MSNIYNLRDCIKYCYESGVIGEVDNVELNDLLDDLEYYRDHFYDDPDEFYDDSDED